MMLRVMLVAALMLTVFPVSSAHAQAAASQASTHSALALDLAKELNSERLLRIQIDQIMNDSLPVALAKDPAMSQLEEQLPGVQKEFIALMKPIIIEDIMSRLPAFQNDAAAVFASGLTTDDMRQLLSFYRGADGQAVIAAMGRNANFDTMLSEQIASGGEKDITVKDIRGITQTAAVDTLRGLTKEQRTAVFRIGLSPAGRKLSAVNQKITALAAKWSNQLSPGTEKKIETAVLGLIERRFAEQKDSSK